MARVKLPPELSSLVHHIELNKAGWWDKAIQGLILAAIWLAGKPLDVASILQTLQDEFHVHVDMADARAQLHILRSSGELLLLPDERLKISEQALRNLERELEEAEHVEEQAKDTFAALIAQHCPSVDARDAWEKFNQQFLLPLVRDVGANTYSLLSGSRLTSKATKFEEFLGAFPQPCRLGLRAAVESLLDPRNANIRSYVLRALNGYFVLEASSLTKEALSALSRQIEAKPSFTIFVDTNFLFSLLGVHDNPLNEAALLLSELIKNVSRSVSVKLYVLPPTIEEAKRVFIGAQHDLRHLRLSPTLADAALRSGLSGIATRFVEECKKNRYGLTAEAYFRPYIADLLSVIRGKGLELFNESLAPYKTRQDVVDDIMGQLERVKTFGGRPKGYEQFEHDVMLWHFVNDKRPAYVESPLGANYWIVTIDYRFMGFDGFKTHNLGKRVRVCLHPTTFIQMLRFWLPRTDEFEAAMLSSIRLPFFFHEFDPDAEKVTIRILSALS